MTKAENDRPLIIVTGYPGQLASALNELEASYPMLQLLFASQEELDITEPRALEAFLQRQNLIGEGATPQLLVINTAAYTAVERAEKEEREAMEVNAFAVGLLAASCECLGALLLHISTDYVFAGESSRPYREEEATSPLNVYGKSKREGELLVNRILGQRGMVVRTSWLYHSSGHNFLKTILHRAKEGLESQVVADQIGSPTYAPHLAQALIEIAIEAIDKGRFPFSTLHYSDNGCCSWYDFAYYAIKQLGEELPLPQAIPSNSYTSLAKRPYYSVLSKERYDQHYSIKRHHWTVGVDEFIKKI